MVPEGITSPPFHPRDSAKSALIPGGLRVIKGCVLQDSDRYVPTGGGSDGHQGNPAAMVSRGPLVHMSVKHKAGKRKARESHGKEVSFTFLNKNRRALTSHLFYHLGRFQTELFVPWAPLGLKSVTFAYVFIIKCGKKTQKNKKPKPHMTT